MSSDPILPTAATVRPSHLRRLQRRAILVALFYAGFCLMLAAFQRSLIYHPFVESDLPAAAAELPPGRVHDLVAQTQDGLDLRGWLVLPNGHSATNREQLEVELGLNRPVVLFFGGNAANRSYRVFEIEVLSEAAADVVIFDYRGYGDNPGTPSEEGLAHDARAVWQHVTEVLRIAPQRIVFYGESLGGGVAIRLASELCRERTPPAGLIVRSTFTSLVDVAAYHYPFIPVRWLLIDRFRNDKRIADVTCPQLHLHGRRDTIVPFSLGQKLFAQAPEQSASGLPKWFVELFNADHNDVIETSHGEVFAAVRDFLSKVTPP